jgi:hypothetical protein
MEEENGTTDIVTILSASTDVITVHPACDRSYITEQEHEK